MGCLLDLLRAGLHCFGICPRESAERVVSLGTNVVYSTRLVDLDNGVIVERYNFGWRPKPNMAYAENSSRCRDWWDKAGRLSVAPEFVAITDNLIDRTPGASWAERVLSIE